MRSSFVKVSNGRVGTIVANDSCGGVFRGHCNVWFGETGADGKPVVEQLLYGDDWTYIEETIRSDNMSGIMLSLSGRRTFDVIQNDNVIGSIRQGTDCIWWFRSYAQNKTDISRINEILRALNTA